MRNLKNIGWVLSTLLFVASLAQAKQIMQLGPHGGRLMQAGTFKVEFHVDKDRKARVYLYDQGLKPVSTDVAQITLKASKGGNKKIDLLKSPSDPKTKDSAVHLAGKTAMPSPDGYLLILNVKMAGAPMNSLRFNFDEHVCGGCKVSEYACICGH